MKKLIIILIAFSFIGCKSRKVLTEVSQSIDKTKTEQESHVSDSSKIEHTDKSKTTVTVSDSSKKVEDENVSIKADSLTYNKTTGEIKATGHAQANVKKHTNTANKINKSLERANDINTNASANLDSTGKKKEDKDKSDSKKTKTVDAKSTGISWFWAGISIIGIVCIYLFVWPWVKSKLSAIFGFVQRKTAKKT